MTEGTVRHISPPLDQLDKLRQPLTSGEKKVLELFHNKLPIEWEIYVQPHLNGLRPDFVLLNPSGGLAVFEVKDWGLDKVIPKSPIEKLLLYREELRDLYCPRLDSTHGIMDITAGLIFTGALRSHIFTVFQKSFLTHERALSPTENPISGLEELDNQDIVAIFPGYDRAFDRTHNEDAIKDLRNWLEEPEYAAEQRRMFNFDKSQMEIVLNKTRAQYRRVRGAAGSGKSLALAARAAQLQSENRKVLVITFNITILNYLRDMAARWIGTAKARTQNITWLNFHYWCKRVCIQTGKLQEYNDLWKNYFNQSNATPQKDDSVLDKQLPRLVEKAIEASKKIEQYDAILVDEAQDLHPLWWNVLRKSCSKDGELLIVSDSSQDIYGRARAWTDTAMSGCGFSGPWYELSVSYRAPRQLFHILRNFSQTYLAKDISIIPDNFRQYNLLEPCQLKWVQTTPENGISVCIDTLIQFAPDADPDKLPMPDITFICWSNKAGKLIKKAINEKGIKIIDTYTDSNHQISRQKKLYFYKGSERIKMTTIHSFKGIETRSLILYLPDGAHRKAPLIYAGLSRLKRSEKGSYMTVICSDPELENFGKQWPFYTKV